MFNQTDVTYVAVDRRGAAHVARRRRVRHARSPTTSATPATSTTRRRRCWCRSARRRSATPVTFRQSATDADNHVRTSVAAAYVQDQVGTVAHAAGGRRAALRSLRPHVSQQPQRRHAAARRQPRLAARRRRLQADRAAVDLRQLQRVVSPELRRSVLVADGRSPSRSSRRSSTTTRSARNGTCGRRLSLHDRGVPAGSHQHALDRSERSDAHRPDRQPAHQRLRAGRQRQPDAGVEHRRRLRLSGRVRDAAPPLRQRPARRSRRFRTTRSRCGTTIRSRRDWAAGSACCTAQRHVRGHRQHRDAARLHARGCRGVLHADARGCALQANVENLLDTRYYINADSNTNISPGFPRTLRVGADDDVLNDSQIGVVSPRTVRFPGGGPTWQAPTPICNRAGSGDGPEYPS